MAEFAQGPDDLGGVGLGNPIENRYARSGGSTDPKVLAGMFDEGPQAITLPWSGEPVTFHSRWMTVVVSGSTAGMG